MAACAKPAPPAFPAKTITWIVPYGPGGGTDILSRCYGEGMETELEMGIIVKNMPGAAGRMGWNTLHKTEPDGYTIGAYLIPGGIVGQLVHETIYDFREVSWLGSMRRSDYVLSVPKDSPFQSIEDLIKADKPVRIAELGVGASSWVAAVLKAETIGYPHTFVTGYANHPALLVAMLKGEGDIATLTLDTPATLDAFKAGDIRLLFTTGKERDPRAPEVPTVAEAGYPELTGLGLYFSTGGPPGMPDDILKILRDAFMKAGQGEITQSMLKKTGMPGTPIPGDELTKIVMELFPIFEARAELFKKAIGG